VSRKMLRAPKRDAVWDEHERLLGLLVDRAAKDSRAAGALASAGHALDRFIDTPGEADGRELAGRLAEAARAFFAAEPLLKRTAYPAGRIIAPDGSLLPPELSKRLAPLGTMGGLAQNILGQLLRTRIDRDGHPAAVAFYGELVRQVSFTMGVYYAAPLEELRCAVGGPRRRGRPAGASASTSGWTEVPATLEGLVELVRSTVMKLRRQHSVVTVTTVAAKLGVDERRLREAFAHYGLRGQALLRQIGREADEVR